LHYEGLVQVVELIEHLRQEGSYSTGETEKIYQSEEADYDGIINDVHSQPKVEGSSEEQS